MSALKWLLSESRTAQLVRLVAIRSAQFAAGCAVVALAFYVAPAKSAVATVGLHIATAHFGGSDMNDSNPGLYAQARTGWLSGASVGVYRNSHRRTSTYAGYTWETSGRWLAITAGAVTGYPTARLMPLIVPSVRVPLEFLPGTTALRISYLAKAVKHGASGLHISVETDL